VHASGGEAMLAAAVDGAGTGCGILGVTVLTSLAPAELAEAWGRGPWIDVRAEVLRLAGLADGAGAHGIVCSGAELGAVVQKFGGRLAPLVPGLRPAGAPANDQARVVTPEQAASEGARYLILGRAVTEAADPLQAWDGIAAAVAGAVRGR
jgi:orotidine-5'-phosphate decarboxylase